MAAGDGDIKTESGACWNAVGAGMKDGRVEMNQENLYDAVIVGGGPAGLTAAIYLARARYRVAVLEKSVFGGQITITAEVVNYPGTGKISGEMLADNMKKQGKDFGAEYVKAEVTGFDLDGDIKTVHTDKGDYRCFTVLLATGAHPRSIGFEGEEKFKGHGVAYCATCDGEFFTGKEVFVIGGGYAAAEESVFLTRYAEHVTILIRGDDFTCAQATADEAREHPKITVLTNTEVKEVKGDTFPESIVCYNSRNGETTVFTPKQTFGVFVFAGYEPATELVRGTISLDEQHYIVTDEAHRTNMAGVYAAGDVCVKTLRQTTTAVGDGAEAAAEMEKYALAMQKKTGFEPRKPESSETKEEKQDKSAAGSIFTDEIRQQLGELFLKMETPLLLELSLDERPVSEELSKYIKELAALTDKITVKTAEKKDADCPCVRVLKQNGEFSGLAFHGVPGGHEFTSFVLGLYNVSGEGQPLDEGIRKKIEALDEPAEMKILVSLTCSVCPELVNAAQKIAALNKNITAEVYDLNYFKKLQDKYNVMSVPCLIIQKQGTEKVTFGRKNINQLLDLLEYSQA